MPRLFALFIIVAGLGFAFLLIDRDESIPREADAIAGEVRDDLGLVAGAIVRLKGGSEETVSDERGQFRLPWQQGTTRVTAWKEGYFIGGSSLMDKPLVIHLLGLPKTDCERYDWIDPTPSANHSMNCGNCHRAIHDEWSRSSHARSATRRRFRNLYEGTDWNGKSGVGWNLLKEHEIGADVCASCHAPTKSQNLFAGVDQRDAGATPSGLSGVHCDFCHKIQGPGEGEFGYTHGRHQLSLLRPDLSVEGGTHMFFGPLNDVDRGEDVFSGFQRDSRLCAACHEGNVFGVPVYTTYSEWLASPAGRMGTSCQSCHMAPTGRMTNIAPGNGGIRRDARTLGNHTFFDGSKIDMIRQCLTLDTNIERTGEGVRINVSVAVRNVGHSVPTGFIDRQMILFVEAYSGTRVIPLLRGPVLPSVLGQEEAGKAGRLYAKVLTDQEGHAPVPFWRADPATLQDSRLQPGKEDRQTFLYPAGVDRVQIRLVHRRFWKQTAKEKHWPENEEEIFTRDVCVP